MRLLVIQDEPRLADPLKRGLEAHGYTVDLARDGTQARARAAEASRYALILLDVPQEGADGVAVLQAIRRSSNVPVLVLTARDTVENRVSGLRLGANDYLVKPFLWPDLLARVQALSRRAGHGQDARVLRLADLALDLANHSCMRGQMRIELTGQEFALLAVLLRARGQVLSRAHLAEQVWDGKLDSDTTNAIEVAIRRLRSKVDEPFARKLLHTVRGQGYVLEDRS